MPSSPSPAAPLALDLDDLLRPIVNSVAYLARTKPADEASVYAGLDRLASVVAPLAPRLMEAQHDPRLKRSARRYRARKLAEAHAADAAAQIKEALTR